VMIYSCTSARSAEIATAFSKSMMSGRFNSVRSLQGHASPGILLLASLNHLLLVHKFNL
jgi:hypothetical protein